MNIRTQTFHTVDACKLSDHLTKEYGREVNIPYEVMEARKKIKLSACGWTRSKAQNASDKVHYEEQLKAFHENKPLDEQMLEALLHDQCIQGKMPEGEYLVEFDD